MEFVNNLKQNILHFKLDLCCFVARVRLGLLLFGYYNVIYSVVALIAVAMESFPPLYQLVQSKIMDGESVKFSAAVACCAELGVSVLLLIGVYRKDVTLLKYYTKLALGMMAGSLLVYAMVLAVLDMLTTLFVCISLIYQLYLVILVRSFIVEIKERASAIKGYTVNLRLNDIESNNVEEKEKYIVSIKSEENKTEIIPISVREDIPKPELSILNKDKERDNVKIEQEVNNKPDIIPKSNQVISKPETSGLSKETTVVSTLKASTTRSPLVTHYPYKFVAIKIPKTTTISEEKEIEVAKEETLKESANIENTKKEGTKKEAAIKGGTDKGKTDKEVKGTAIKEDATDEEVIKSIIKPPKRTIFGRKKKTIESTADVDVSKKS